MITKVFNYKYNKKKSMENDIKETFGYKRDNDTLAIKNHRKVICVRNVATDLN